MMIGASAPAAADSSEMTLGGSEALIVAVSLAVLFALLILALSILMHMPDAPPFLRPRLRRQWTQPEGAARSEIQRECT